MKKMLFVIASLCFLTVFSTGCHHPHHPKRPPAHPHHGIRPAPAPHRHSAPPPVSRTKKAPYGGVKR